MFTLAELEAAAELVHVTMPPTPVYQWPLLAERSGAEVWVKHENHTPTGAFKVRGGLVLFDRLARHDPPCPGVVSATRGNHGQSLAFAGGKTGIPVKILAPHGNSREKNAAMRAFGAELLEIGQDFEEARQACEKISADEGLRMIQPFEPELVLGVATYALELFQAEPDLDTVYVPIGMGSGICGLIRTRDLLGLSTRIVGVVSERAPAYALSVEAGRIVATNDCETLADGVACRSPMQQPLDMILAGAERVVRVSDKACARAMRAYYQDTHNLAEGAGALPLAALMQERAAMAGKRVGLILSGGNVDWPVFKHMLDDLAEAPGTEAPEAEAARVSA